MCTHSIHVCFYTEMDIKYTGCNLKTSKLLDHVLIGVYVVIRSNTVFQDMFNNTNVYSTTLVKQNEKVHKIIYNVRNKLAISDI